MKARLLTAAIGVPLVIVLLILGEHFPWIMYLAIAVLCSLMSFELLTASKLHKKASVVLPCLIFSLAEPLLVVTSYKLLNYSFQSILL